VSRAFDELAAGQISGTGLPPMRGSMGRF